MNMELFVIVGVLLCVHGISANLSTTYIGHEWFELNKDAALVCQVDPIPAPNGFTVTWLNEQSDGTNAGIGKSYSNQNDSFVYSTAPEQLKNRFTMSSANFDFGTADATISGIQIGDEGIYVCAAEITSPPSSKQAKFPIRVYSTPTVTIRQVQAEFDIRPPMPTEAPEATEPPTEVPGEEVPTEDIVGTESTEAPSTTPPTTTTTVQTPSEVAVCEVTNAYPMPANIQFIQLPGNQIIADVAAVVSSVANADQTYNASATLSLDVTSELDKATILCKVVLAPQHTYESNETPEYTVYYHPDQVQVRFSSNRPREGDHLTVYCEANGNPTPVPTLRLPDNTEVQVRESDFGHPLRVTQDHAGLYTCIIDVSEETTIEGSDTLVVEWMERPTLTGTPPNGKAKLGSKLEVTCETSGLPTPTYSWRKDGTYYSGNRHLVINSMKFKDEGTYTCVADGAISLQEEFTVEVTSGCALEAIQKVSASSVKGGQARVEIQCKATGNPKCTVTMYDSDNKVIRSGNENVTYVQDSVPKQMVAPEYTCTAENAHNSTTVKVIVNDQMVCCADPQTSGLSAGVIVIIILLIALVVVGIPLAWYCIKKRNKGADEATEKTPEDPAEGEKLTKPDDKDGTPMVQYQAQDDFRLNNAKPMRTFSQK